MFYSEVFLLHIGHRLLSSRRSKEQHENIQALAIYLPQYLPLYGIDNEQRQAHFLGQIYVESQSFSRTEENLNYSRNRFHQVFPNRAKQYDHWEKMEGQCVTSYDRIDRPKLAGDTAYSDRMGNDAYMSDDGYRYRGRGFIQVTGKENYAEVGRIIGIDLLKSPDLLSEPQYALMSACCFWQHNHLNVFADRDNFHGLTIAINGGLQALVARKEYTLRVKEMQKTWDGPVAAV